LFSSNALAVLDENGSMKDIETSSSAIYSVLKNGTCNRGEKIKYSAVKKGKYLLTFDNKRRSTFIEYIKITKNGALHSRLEDSSRVIIDLDDGDIVTVDCDRNSQWAGVIIIQMLG
jgi:hypothetical protein